MCTRRIRARKVCTCRKKSSRPTFVDFNPFRGDDTQVSKLSRLLSCAMLARSAIRAETRFFKVPRGGEGHCLQKSFASGGKIRQLSGRFSPWSDDQILSAVSSGHSIGANSRSTPKIFQFAFSRTGQLGGVTLTLTSDCV